LSYILLFILKKTVLYVRVNLKNACLRDGAAVAGGRGHQLLFAPDGIVILSDFDGPVVLGRCRPPPPALAEHALPPSNVVVDVIRPVIQFLAVKNHVLESKRSVQPLPGIDVQIEGFLAVRLAHIVEFVERGRHVGVLHDPSQPADGEDNLLARTCVLLHHLREATELEDGHGNGDIRGHENWQERRALPHERVGRGGHTQLILDCFEACQGSGDDDRGDVHVIVLVLDVTVFQREYRIASF